MKENPRHILAIDPGKAAGGAFFIDGQLKWAALIDADAPESEPYAMLQHLRGLAGVCTLVEIPIAYMGARSKVDPNNLITTAFRAGKLAGDFSETIKPVTWKGNVPDHVIYKRIYAALAPDEANVLPRIGASRMHNVLDAVGIGLHRLQRLRKQNV